MAERPHFGGHAYAFERSLGKKVAKDFFTVRPVESDDPHLYSIARMFQRIKQKALTEQLKGKVLAREVALSADPSSTSLVNSQLVTIKNRWNRAREKGGYYRSEYMIAETLVCSSAYIEPQLEVIGFGAASEFTFWNNREPRVTIQEVYVDPQFQNAKVGSAIVRSLLDEKPKDAKLLSTNLAELNPRISQLAQRFGFVAALGAAEVSEISERWFDRSVKAEVYMGPTVKELAEELEAKGPLLKDRVAFGPYDNPLG